MHKFKVGDRVAYIGSCFNTIENPCTVEEYDVYQNGCLYHITDNVGETYCVGELELEEIGVYGYDRGDLMGGSEGIEVNEQGGKGSKIETGYQHIPNEVLQDLSKVFYEGSTKYEPDNWKRVTADEHYNHLMNHIVNDRISPNKEECAHALCRMVMYYYIRNYK